VRHPLLSLAVLAILVAPFGSPTPAESQASCPVTQFHCVTYEGESLGGVSYDPSGEWYPDQSTGNFISWDFAGGYFHCVAGLGEMELITTATYTVGNLPPGTPVIVRARFGASGSLTGGAGGYDSVSVRGPGPNGSWTGYNLTGPGPPVEMVFEGLSDQPFGIEIHLWARAFPVWLSDPWVVLGAGLQFYDLPAGAAIIPCQAPTISVQEGPQPGFALQSPSPNPTRRSFAVSLALPTSKPSTLTLHDIAGRLIQKVDLTGYGAGRHTVRFGERDPLRPGVYLVRLVQGAHQANVRAIVLQ
jgi:hypothetical protein